MTPRNTADRPPASGEPSSEALRNALEEVLDVWPAPSPEAFHRLHRLLTGHDSCDGAEARATPPALDVDLLRRCRAHIESIEQSYLGDKRSTVAAVKLLAEVDARLADEEPDRDR